MEGRIGSVRAILLRFLVGVDLRDGRNLTPNSPRFAAPSRSGVSFGSDHDFSSCLECRRLVGSAPPKDAGRCSSAAALCGSVAPRAISANRDVAWKSRRCRRKSFPFGSLERIDPRRRSGGCAERGADCSPRCSELGRVVPSLFARTLVSVRSSVRLRTTVAPWLGPRFDPSPCRLLSTTVTGAQLRCRCAGDRSSPSSVSGGAAGGSDSPSRCPTFDVLL